MNDISRQTVEDGQVVTLNYVLTVDGEVVDSSEEGQPITFIQGQGQIIRGLESELYGMEVGQNKDVVVQPENGYGEVDPENYSEFPRNQFPPEIPLEPGVELELRDKEGETVGARIDSISDDSVRLNFNHPLAGKELHFSVEVIELRNATDDEIAHGHVHDGHEH
ncbi:MAG: FKBP-type peptidyl-prolyl cis-trans isomerase [Omnitrophica WOR_2 bacterium]